MRYKDGKFVVRCRNVTSEWAKNSGGLASIALDCQADLIHAELRQSLRRLLYGDVGHKHGPGRFL
jgi:hypothetical protein